MREAGLTAHPLHPQGGWELKRPASYVRWGLVSLGLNRGIDDLAPLAGLRNQRERLMSLNPGLNSLRMLLRDGSAADLSSVAGPRSLSALHLSLGPGIGASRLCQA